jgi:hypothetical protein
MWNRREMLSRIHECQRQGGPITNYGLVIAYALGILERALQPFPEALSAYTQARKKQAQLAEVNLPNRDEFGLSLVHQ